MATIFEKMNSRATRKSSCCRRRTALRELARLPVVIIHHHLESLPRIGFALAFVTSRSQIDILAPQIAARAEVNATAWFAYSKGTSKKFTCDLNRDTGCEAMRAEGFDTARTVSIGGGWTALRFRRNAYIGKRSRGD